MDEEIEFLENPESDKVAPHGVNTESQMDVDEEESND